MENIDKRRVNIRAIIWQDGKLLAVKHKNKDSGESDFWALPGGGLDPGESLKNGLKRELEEEMGIKAKIGKLLFIQQFPSSRQYRDEELEFLFHVTNPDDFTHIDLTSTSHGALEIARCEFIDPTCERILPAFLQTIAIADYITHDQPVFIYDQLS